MCASGRHARTTPAGCCTCLLWTPTPFACFLTPPHATHPPHPAAREISFGTFYASAIEAAIDKHEAEGHRKLAALLMEPVLQGVGGMLCVDPSFQRALVKVRHRSGLGALSVGFG